MLILMYNNKILSDDKPELFLGNIKLPISYYDENSQEKI